MAGQVRHIPGAIGYVELAYASQNNVAWAALRNRAGHSVEPSAAGTIAAMEGVDILDNAEVMLVDSAHPDAYPICGFTWVLVYRDQSNAAAARTLASLLWWATHGRQETVALLDYAPLSASAPRAAEGQLKRMTAQRTSAMLSARSSTPSLADKGRERYTAVRPHAVVPARCLRCCSKKRSTSCQDWVAASR
jgi:phosphate transport system substrate-binding protein